MKKILAGVTSGVLAMTIFAGAAGAEVTYDFDKKEGFVPKGDVQSALGLNNKQFQDDAYNFEFMHETVDTYEIIVTWTTGEGTKGEKAHIVEHKRESSVTSEVASEPRKKNQQVTGFTLGALESSVSDKNIPAVGDYFPGNSGHKVTSVELVSSDSYWTVDDVRLK
ncbi:hypothetical protein [Alteribacter natronophilus]|uniref:hypothetical protein n=1 Tax=Alteribacter natronophilus TaxID=2583810 RepID=UPI00110E1BA4|nr:hypothetical protein [Alteribacter natronophilus]TMW70749.1 hypothetical protein FGB90_16360 [Alteribacter natronophilus]